MAERLGEAKLELSTSDVGLKKGVDQAHRSAKGLDSQFDKTKRKSKEVGSALGSMGGRGQVAAGALMALKGGGIAAAGGLVVLGGALTRTKAAVAELDRIGKQARAGGLSPEIYQEYAFAADLAGLSAKEFDKGARTLFKNANDAALGTGLMKTSLEKLNPELLENIINARSQEERFRLVADAVKNATTELEKGAIAQAAFGGKGTAFINFLDQGAAGLDRLSAEAREMGIVIENDVVANAEQMNDKLSIASKIIDANLNKAFVNLAPVLVEVTQLTAELVAEVVALIDSFRDVENRATSSLKERKSELDADLAEVANRPVSRRFSQDAIDAEKHAIEKELAEINGQLNQRRLEASFNLQDRTFSRGNALGVNTPRKASAKAATEQRDAVMDVVNALRFEASQLGLSNVEQRINNELKAAGVSRASEAGQAIAKLVQDIETEKQAIEASNQAAETRKQKLQELNDLQVTVGESAVNVGAAFLRGSEEGKRALIELGFQILQLIAKTESLNGGGLFSSLLGLFGAGGGGNLLSSLFGGLPGFDNGTSFTVGGMGGIDNNLVAFRASRGERVDVVTPGQQRSGAGGRIDLHITGEEGGTFAPRVQGIAGDVAKVTVRDAAPNIIGESVRQAGENVVPNFSNFRSQKAGGDYRT